MARRNERPKPSECTAASLRDSSKSNSLVWDAVPGESDDPKLGGRRNRGSGGEHIRSPAYYSCTDGAADEARGMKSESRTGKERDGHVLGSVHKEHRIGELPRKAL